MVFFPTSLSAKAYHFADEADIVGEVFYLGG